MGGYVFISYSTKNQQLADFVKDMVVRKGMRYWMAPYCIPAGAKYAYAINDAIENCSCFLLLLTQESQSSEFVEREVERAISYQKPVIPIQFGEFYLNSGFRFYIGNSQIIRITKQNEMTPEIEKIMGVIYRYVMPKIQSSLEYTYDRKSVEDNEYIKYINTKKWYESRVSRYILGNLICVLAFFPLCLITPYVFGIDLIAIIMWNVIVTTQVKKYKKFQKIFDEKK